MRLQRHERRFELQTTAKPEDKLDADDVGDAAGGGEGDEGAVADC